MKIKDVIRGVEEKESPKGKDCTCMAQGNNECGCSADWTDNDRYNSLANVDVVVDEKAIAMLMTKVSEEKYHGNAFTYNYMVDVIAQAITTAIESGEIISLKGKE